MFTCRGGSSCPMHSAPPSLGLGAPAPNSAQPSPEKEPQISRQTSPQILVSTAWKSGRSHHDTVAKNWPWPAAKWSGWFAVVVVGPFLLFRAGSCLLRAATALACCSFRWKSVKLWGGGVLLEPARGKVTGFFGPKPPRTYLGPVFYDQVRSDLVLLQIIYPMMPTYISCRKYSRANPS